jgi:hypothetical protein
MTLGDYYIRRYDVKRSLHRIMPVVLVIFRYMKYDSSKRTRMTVIDYPTIAIESVQHSLRVARCISLTARYFMCKDMENTGNSWINFDFGT